MILITAESSPAGRDFSLSKALLLASVVTGKKETLFHIEGGGDIPALVKGKGIQVLENSTPGALFRHPVSLVFFFKDKMSGTDKNILTKAQKKKIPVIKFSRMGKHSADADLIIDPTPAEYEEGQEVLSGPAYSILDGKYIHFHKKEKKYQRGVKKVLLAPGDHLPYRELRKLTETLINHGYRVKLLPGKNFKRFNRKTLKRLYPTLAISGRPVSNARSFYDADLAIIDPADFAVGSAATGTPAVYMPRNETGEALARHFEAQGAGLIFRKWKKENFSEILEILKYFSPEIREKMGKTGKEISDGRGIYRIAEALQPFLKEK